MSRTGKIARLPRLIREQLNRRLADGEVGSRLVAWLNDLPEVKSVLKQNFGGRPITEQNLSEWRQGGFEDWLRHEDARAWAGQLAEECDDLDQESGAVPLYDRAAYPALLAICGLIHAVRVSPNPTEQRRSVISAAHELTNLRRASHQAERLRFDRERWEAAQQKERDIAAHRAEIRRLENERLDLFQAEAHRDAQMRATILSDLPFDRVALSCPGEAQRSRTCPSVAPQSRTRPNVTSQSRTRPGIAQRSRKIKSHHPKTSRKIRLHPTKSNQIAPGNLAPAKIPRRSRHLEGVAPSTPTSKRVCTRVHSAS